MELDLHRCGGAAKSALWPFLHFYKWSTADPDAKPHVDEKGHYSGGTLRPTHNRLSDYVNVFCGQLPKILIAAFIFTHTVDMEAASKGWDFSVTGWVFTVVWRDLLLMLALAGTWDFLLYSSASPFHKNMAPYKFNKLYPSSGQLQRDIFWTTSATILGSVQEVLVMRYWNLWFSSAPFDAFFFNSPHTLGFLLWTVTMVYWRILHFYLIHRMMHPWWPKDKSKRPYDVGLFLYKHVHAHHHKSRNPTAFSGFSMTPVESILYISAAAIPLLFQSGQHPWIHLYTKLDLIFGAQIGHDGFDAPGGGSYYHQLHHAHFECNYGDAAVPMDWWFGTFEDGSSYDKKKEVEKLKSDMNQRKDE